MSEVFLKLINMSISASWLILAVLLLRFVLKKAPRWSAVLLWAIVALRLVLPFSIESVLSLIPSPETVPANIMMARSPEIHSGLSSVNSLVNPVISEAFAPAPAASANPLQILIPVCSVIWCAGISLMLLYTLVSWLRLRSKVSTAVLLRENIYQSENVASPFVLGIFSPRIYLPTGMESSYVIAHEQAHIRRRDHWWKPLGFLLLTLHWFNPLMWLAYILLCRDIELACDEKVVKELEHDERADYSQALLLCSVRRHRIAACPLAFGEVGVKTRVRSVLNYKKPAFWLIIVAVLACIAVALCFLTDPKAAFEEVAEQPNWGEIDSIRYDIDGDGVTEDCSLNYGTTSGLSSVVITAKLDGMVKYSQSFIVNFYRIGFAENEKGLALQIEERSGRIYHQDIYKDGDIFALSEPYLFRPAELTVGKTYVTGQCLYLSPMSNASGESGNDGWRYTVHEDSMEISSRLLETDVSRFVDFTPGEWQPFPYSGEELADMYSGQSERPTDGCEEILYQVLGETNTVEKFYTEVDTTQIIMLADGELWVVGIMMNLNIGPVFWSIATLIPEENA